MLFLLRPQAIFADPTHFADSPGHAAKWAGLCPGNRESAGKRLNNRTAKGKHGIRKAIVATAHHILITAFCILRDHTEYRGRGGNYFDLLAPGTHAQPAGAQTRAARTRALPSSRGPDS